MIGRVRGDDSSAPDAISFRERHAERLRRVGLPEAEVGRLLDLIAQFKIAHRERDGARELPIIGSRGGADRIQSAVQDSDNLDPIAQYRIDQPIVEPMQDRATTASVMWQLKEENRAPAVDEFTQLAPNLDA